MVAAPGGSSVVDVRDLASVIERTMEPGRGPRRYVTGGHFLTWEGWAETLSRAVGREIPTHVMTAEQLIEMGRQFDTMRREGKADFPLSEEAAVIMTAGIPTDDSAAITELGASWRPTVETFRDAVAWLIDESHLPPEPGLGRSS
jgi:nucleoside-diphosphate-sugar epimerase